jgi:vesicle transport through interaction with t-SNAREs protein 1
MTDLFDRCESDINGIVSNVQIKIGAINQTTGEQKKAAVRQAERDMAEARDILQQMDVETHSMSSGNRGQCLTRIRNLKANIERLSRELNSAARGGTYGSTSHVGFEEQQYSGDPQRQRLLMAQERLDRTNQSLKNSERLAAENESMGIGILGDLEEQRGTIERSHQQLLDTNANLTKSDKALRSMQWRNCNTKLIAAAVVIVIIIIVVVVCYVKLK